MSSGEDRYPRPNPRPRPKPKPKPRPKPKAARAVMPGDPGFGTGTDARARARAATPRSTSARVKVKSSGRVVQPRYKSKPKAPAQSAGDAWFEGSANAARRPTKSREQLEDQAVSHLKAAGLSGAPGVGGIGDFLGNLGGDAVSIITGIPNAAQLTGKAAAAPVLMALGKDEAANKIYKEYAQSQKAVVDDYKYRYGPLFRGDVGTFGERSFEHPGLLGLDVAGVASLGGSALRAGAATLGRIAPETRLGAAAARTGSRSAVIHARPPRTVTARMGENSRATHTVTVEQRPFSRSNPGTRGLQKGGAKVRAKFRTYTEGKVETGDKALGILPVPKGIGAPAKHARAVVKVARDFRQSRDLARSKRLRLETRPYVEAVQKLDKATKATKEQVDAALFLHSRDMLRVKGKTPLQARDAVVKYMRDGLDEAVKGRESKHTGAAQTIDAIAKIPDDLLHLDRVPELAAAVDQYRALAGKATRMRVAAGTVSREAAAVAPARAAQMVHEGMQFNQKAGVWTSPRNPYSPVGSRAVYTKDVARDPLVGGGKQASRGSFGRLTGDKEYQSHGTLFSQGNVQIDRGLPIRSYERAITDQMHPQFVKDVFDTFAFRKPKGGLAKGPRAVQAMAADPESVVLVSEKSLTNAMRKIKDLPEGEHGEGPFRGVVMAESEDDLAKMTPKQQKDLVAFPKAAIEGIREGWDAVLGRDIKALQKFDTVQSLWKRGILAFFPRWYLNSLFGNATQYVLATGGDAMSVYKAMKNPDWGSERVKGSTNVAEARTGDPRVGTPLGNKYRKMTDRFMGKQAGFDSLWRRALEINRMRQGLRAEGVKGTRRMSMDDLGKAMEEADPRVLNQVTRDVELWLGDYMRMSPTERATLRRIFPFYSWMRVIGKLTLNMPLRYPKRTAFLSLYSRAATASQNATDPLQPILANRGMFNLPGGLAMRSAGANPFFTHADILKDVAGLNPQGLAQSLGSNLSPIGPQQGARIFSGRNAFGAPLTFAPGADGSASVYGGSTKREDPVTHLPDYFSPQSVTEAFLESVPGYTQVRQAASGGRTPYDNVTLFDILGGGDKRKLFQTQRDKALTPFPGIPGAAASWAGLNVQRRNRKVEAEKFKKAYKDWSEAQDQTEKRVRKLKP